MMVLRTLYYAKSITVAVVYNNVVDKINIGLKNYAIERIVKKVQLG